MGQRRGQQRGREATVLLARGVHETARVAGVRLPARVDQQAEQALGLRPALDGVLLVDLAGVLGQAPDPGVGLVAAADPALGKRLEHDLGALAALVARPAGHDVDRGVEGLGISRRGDLLERPQAQLRVAVALERGQQEAALELALAVEVEHRLGPAPAVGGDSGSGQRRPHVLLAVVEVLDSDPPQLALEHLGAPLGIRSHWQHAALDAHAPAAAAAHGPDHDRASAVNVAVKQRVQRHHRVIVLGRRVHEVDHDARLLARHAAASPGPPAAGRCAWMRSEPDACRSSRGGCSSPRPGASR